MKVTAARQSAAAAALSMLCTQRRGRKGRACVRRSARALSALRSPLSARLARRESSQCAPARVRLFVRLVAALSVLGAFVCAIVSGRREWSPQTHTHTHTHTLSAPHSVP